MSEWKTTTLGDFISLQRGHDLPFRERRPGEIPVIGSGGITGFHDTAVACGPGITIGRAANLGVPTLIQEDFWPLNTTLYVTDFHRNDVRFTYYLLQTLDLTGFNSGSVQPMLNRNYIRNFPIMVPGQTGQRAISTILGTLDDKIAVNDRIASLSEQLSQAIFTDSFSDALAFLKAGAKLPYGWSPGAFGEVCAVLETGRRPKGGVSGYTCGVPSIGAESITRLAEFDFAKVKYVPEDYFAGMRQGIVEDYDILLYKDGGRPGNFEPHVSMFGRGFPFDRMCINEHVYRIRLRKPMSQAYGYFWLISDPIMTEMRSRGTGVAIPGLNSSAVRDLPIVCPPAERLARFDACVVPLIDQALNAASESRTLSQLRDTLLPRLMSGEIRVRDAEKVVEDVT